MSQVRRINGYGRCITCLDTNRVFMDLTVTENREIGGIILPIKTAVE